MTWLVVARKDVADAARSRLLWATIALFAGLTSLTVVLPLVLPVPEEGAVAGVQLAAQFAGSLVPITALVAAYLSVAGERESGSLKILLGFPPSRRDVVLGKFVGRSFVVLVAAVAGFSLAGVVALAAYGTLPVGAFAGVAALTGLLAVVFVGIAVGLSAAFDTRGRAMTAAVGVYVVLTVLWDMVPLGTHVAVTGELPGATVPAWFYGVTAFSPTGAYNMLTRSVLDGAYVAPSVVGRVAGEIPFYLDARFLVVVVVAWTVVPLVLGYWRFERADL
ncbi:ABC transporter permease subunit [Halobacterium wangiae]|uniref:ABC transporter permease subunit n=1 Tax=Halobacterium wangiae TaxID=2902623 RepID=UPI001E5ED0AC|nr:ABC transporter permease subunit [Halobacterium wangiae]